MQVYRLNFKILQMLFGETGDGFQIAMALDNSFKAIAMIDPIKVFKILLLLNIFSLLG